MSLLNEEESVTPTPSVVESTPLLAKTSGVDTRYGATGGTSSQSVPQRRNEPRSFDFDARTPGDSTPSSPPNARPPQSRDVVHPISNDSAVGPRPTPQESLLEKVRNRTSLTLVNSGSVARDHLASERTFLAYIRTSLAIASSGVALVQLFSVAANSSSPPKKVVANYANVQWFVRPLGAVAIIIGISVLVIGVTRYFLVQSALTKGYFPAARSAMAFISLSLAAMIGATFSFLVTSGKLHPTEP
ncbi:hypothetical protein FA13DRAFT_1740646 [Coprinellus micaceus]|uniref:DUF202 domain-containing protein n=1 Tax=Coprinellus micaceus TaxID=71717 RepID=A0A4Y7SLU6_COPMI|nr:hypothetical protein FA13DRAFT_1740646 [Coprinellus micaceus]